MLGNFEKVEKNTNNEINSQEIEKIKRGIKDEIENYINSNMLKEAEQLIKEYEKHVKNDIDIYSMRGIISIMQENFDEAEDVLHKGLLMDSSNKDILYNIAYLYKTIGKISKSAYFYKKLYYITQDHNDKKNIEEELKLLGSDIKNKVLIGSPIHQKPQILKEFLESLIGLDNDNIDVDYFFIDDNGIEESSVILNNFAAENSNVFIKKSEHEDDYVCNNNTHVWKENLVWKVASFKDIIIKYAKANYYDYLFFIDSDLVLRPETLKHLISTGKDIISEIFWTKWNLDSTQLPQVWLSDQYNQYRVSRGEQLSSTDVYNRHLEFINTLKIPGVYEVGGLGACTLISKFAIDKGISFEEIKNLLFWGEDRHFCIRAAALGLSLYVDTHYPAYHIYRESDLEGVKEFKDTYYL